MSEYRRVVKSYINGLRAQEYSTCYKESEERCRKPERKTWVFSSWETRGNGVRHSFRDVDRIQQPTCQPASLGPVFMSNDQNPGNDYSTVVQRIKGIEKRLWVEEAISQIKRG